MACGQLLLEPRPPSLFSRPRSRSRCSSPESSTHSTHVTASRNLLFPLTRARAVLCYLQS